MDRFETIVGAFSEAKKTGVPLKAKHINWLILEHISLQSRIIVLEEEIEEYWRYQAGASI